MTDKIPDMVWVDPVYICSDKWSKLHTPVIPLDALEAYYKGVKECTEMNRRQDNYDAGVVHGLSFMLDHFRKAAGTDATRQTEPEKRVSRIGQGTPVSDIDDLQP